MPSAASGATAKAASAAADEKRNAKAASSQAAQASMTYRKTATEENAQPGCHTLAAFKPQPDRK